MRFRLTIICALMLATSSAAMADGPPQWLQDAARQATPVFTVKDVPAVVLTNEQLVNVSADGTIVTTTRVAMRVLTRAGRSEAVASNVYQTDSEKVKDLNAWVLHPSGPPKDYGKKETLDIARVENDVYNEARVKIIDATKDVVEGDVFGFETTSETKSIFSQFVFQFQEDLPVLRSHFSMVLPAGWSAKGVTFNHASVEPSVAGSNYNWELNELPPINHEAGSPKWASLSPRLAVSFFPDQAAGSAYKSFANWSDVAHWMAEVEDPQMQVDDALAAKTHDLTDALPNQMDKIRAIAKYVQQIQYISVQTGLGKGGGYKPHTSTEVFAKSYGDCKDKANLMRAMLSVIKVPAYMVSITADDRDFVKADFPSPYQFNHCIIAIKVPDSVALPAVVTHPQVGRVLIFDPTDPYTTVGDLPQDEQGSLALIDNKDTTALTEMPVTPAESNRLERKIDASIEPTGAIAGIITELSSGQTAVRERARSRMLSSPEFNGVIERWVARDVTGARTSKIEAGDTQGANGQFRLNVNFSAASYAQLMQNHLLVFKPNIIGRLDNLSFTEGKRTHPFIIDPTSYSESVQIKLPAGFTVDEIPDAVNMETDFGKYSIKYEVVSGTLKLTRSLSLSRTAVPAEKYDTVRQFFGRVREAEQAQVVLVKN